MLRYALTNNRSVNDAFNTADLFDFTARGSAFYDDNSLNGSWTSTLSPHLLNQLSFEAAQRRAALRTPSPNSPGVIIAGLAQFGTPFAGNTRRYETHADLGDDVTLQHGKHLLQAGVAFTHVSLRAADLDGFAGLYAFADLASLSSGQPDFYTQSLGNPDTNFGELRSAAYAQDHWTPTRSLAVDLGLRYESNRLPAPLTQSANHFSPRVGLAWSPDKNLVVRGGFGIFLDRYLLSTTNRILEFDGVQAQQQVAEGSAAAALYQSGQRFTAPQAGIAPSIWQAQPALANPYAETASLGVERAFPSQWTASAEYRFVHGVKMGRTLNSNLPPPVALTAANAASLGVASPTPQQIGRFTFPLSRLNPAYDAIQQFQAEASSTYNGVTFSVNRQFTEDFELLAGYTFSKTLDDASYDTEEPQSPYALAAERALSLQDQRQRFVLSGLWVLGPDLDDPVDAAKAAAPGPVMRVLTGLEFAPILTVNSGFRDNPLTGLDSERAHTYPFTARPLGLSRDTLQTPAGVDFDLRILKMVPIWRGHLDIVAESFNLLNQRNVDLLNPVFGSAATASAEFQQPIQAADARKIQFSLDFEY
jgi:outer membrane receptor protein involved in Fe transport